MLTFNLKTMITSKLKILSSLLFSWRQIRTPVRHFVNGRNHIAEVTIVGQASMKEAICIGSFVILLPRNRILCYNIQFSEGDLTQKFPTFSNLILNLSFYTNADPKSTYMSNIQQNSVELWTNLRFCNHTPIS